MWLTTFLLGRPGYEHSFEVPPDAMQIDEGPIEVLQRNLAGDLKVSQIKNFAPNIRINSGYMSLSERNALASLSGVSDTFLSFQVRDDLQAVAERNLSTDATHVKIQNNSITKLSAALVAAGFSSVITINSVSQIPNVVAGNTFGGGGFGDLGFSGPDFYAGGSYDDATRTVTLGTSIGLPTQQNLYVSYTYKGWLVKMNRFPHGAAGGKVNIFSYDCQLIGA